jgi:hypothetical protein
MRTAYVNGLVTAPAATVALLLAVSPGGCATSTAGSSLMSARIEMPVPSTIRPYLPVDDLPQNHQMLMMPDEQSKLRNQLIAARARQEASVKASQQQ